MTFTSIFIFVFVISRFKLYKKCYIMYASLLSGQAPATTFQYALCTSIGTASSQTRGLRTKLLLDDNSSSLY
jgi:hypothetical protein